MSPQQELDEIVDTFKCNLQAFMTKNKMAEHHILIKIDKNNPTRNVLPLKQLLKSGDIVIYEKGKFVVDVTSAYLRDLKFLYVPHLS